jgi:hypothetical protein
MEPCFATKCRYIRIIRFSCCASRKKLEDKEQTTEYGGTDVGARDNQGRQWKTKVKKIGRLIDFLRAMRENTGFRLL